MSSKLPNAIEMEEMTEKTILYFSEGYNCSESVLLGYAEANKIDSDIIPRIATGFGGGIARTGSVCGALTGVIMAIGLKYGRDKPDQEAYDLCISKSSECFKRFKKEFGDFRCRNLIECDLSTQEGRTLFKKRKLREKNCMKYIEGASRILFNLTKL